MKKVGKILAIAGVLLLLLIAAFVIFFIVIPNNELKKLEEERLRQEMALEEQRKALFEEDIVNLEFGEYDGVFLSMTDASGWDKNLFSGYIGVNLVRNQAVIESEYELTRAWEAAEQSGSALSYNVMILDPFKLYRVIETLYDEGGEPESEYVFMFDPETIFGAHPDSEFRVFMPFYTAKYWEDNYTEETFSLAISAYRELLAGLTQYDNVYLSCFTGYDWLVENPRMFNEEGTGLTLKSSETLFLYNYKEPWQVKSDDISGILREMQNNLWFADPVEPEKHWYDVIINAFKAKETVEEEPVVYEYEGFEDYDVIFFGDSIFALADGPYSIPSYFENLTGARCYNMSKGGLPAVKYFADVPSMKELAEYIVWGAPTKMEGYEVFDREVKRFAEDDHTGRKLLIVTDFGTNDYMFGTPDYGEGEESYEGAVKAGLDVLVEAFPEAEYMTVALYYMYNLDNGTVLNDYGHVLDDYNDLLEEISKEYAGKGFSFAHLDLEKASKINSSNGDYYLDDGIHPSIAGNLEVVRVLIEALGK